MASTLGRQLSSVRSARGESVKTVATAAEISAAYLQKLEGDEVRSPSPNILHKLAGALEVPYETLMAAAGYVVPTAAGSGSGSSPLAHALDSSDLTDKERKAVTEFIATLRSLRDD